MADLSPQPVDRLLAPFREFSRREASGGVLLMVAAVVALAWANSPFADSYAGLWQTELTIGVGDLALAKPLLLWINDGLMAVFFLVVGLEIKREVLVGELATVRKAMLPIAAAVGGAVLPALLFVLIAGGDPEAIRGWGVPMATDIAFALGVLALLGSRAPVGLRIFLTALAIVDDLLAVLVIAVFYSSGLSPVALAAAAAVLVALVAANRLGVRRPLVYAVLGVGLWVAILQSGIHATIAGVLLAMTIPARTRIDRPAFVEGARRLVANLSDRRDAPSDEEHHATLWDLEDLTEHAQAPMLRIEHALLPWVAFLIVPLFALANAGVAIGGDLGGALTSPTALGVIVGLVIGKQIGITLGAWLVVRAGLAALPDGVSWRHVYGGAWLGGIGFTMSLFVADLAFGESSLALAKIGILAASVIAGVGGYLVLWRVHATR
ncbi:MAG TPA: Na+/H+ antiporter NhaA [Candidatus Limnocylindrales bacterium]|nr:Na+/H+ antiporter NhaA [Candidatus Limnocylindrales bacterium]